MKKMSALIILVFCSLFMFSCTSTKTTGDGEGGLKNQKIDGYLVSVKKGDTELKSYKIDDIKKMQGVSVEIEGKSQDGPLLVDLLKDAGVEKFSSVVIKGMYKTKIEVDSEKASEIILDITNHDTIKMASKSISKSKWVKDIIEINVQE